MKKNLQNAMAQNFQKMVGAPSTVEEKPEPKSSSKNKSNASNSTQKVNESTTSVVKEEPVQQPAPQQIPVVEPAPAPVAAPVAQSAPAPAANIPVEAAPVYTQPVQPVYQAPTPVYEENIPVPQNNMSNVAYNEVQPKNSSKKSIPLMPEEKSSGVLHIRLGELRSYVDFITQSSKISYQQYISNLIEQDYERNKDLYLKYKSFMEQLNM